MTGVQTCALPICKLFLIPNALFKLRIALILFFTALIVFLFVQLSGVAWSSACIAGDATCIPEKISLDNFEPPGLEYKLDARSLYGLLKPPLDLT